MRAPSTSCRPGASRGAAALARGARLLITGRYHPAVFAAPAGVPVLGLVTDDYTAVKQRGALAHWGQDAVVPDHGGRAPTASRSCDRVRPMPTRGAAAAARRPAHRAAAAEWWDRIADRFA